MATRFTGVFADTTGTDPYCQSVSDAHQDLFGEATFHGKAIYDVQAFRSALANRFPVDTILSHDLIEGAYAGVGLATDIELFENVPLDYVAYSKREHRWIRGDWLIASWIFSRVPGPDGHRVQNPLSIDQPLAHFRQSEAELGSHCIARAAAVRLAGISRRLGYGAWWWASRLSIPTLAPLLDRLRAAHSRHGSTLARRGSGRGARARDDCVPSLSSLGFGGRDRPRFLPPLHQQAPYFGMANR